MSQRGLPLFLLLLLALSAAAAEPPYRDAQRPVSERVEDLLGRMTPREKFWQLFMLAGGLDQGVGRYEHGAFGFQLQTACDGTDPIECVNAIQRRFVEETRLGIPVILFEESLHGLVQADAVVYPQAIGLAATFDAPLMREISGAMGRECRARGIRQVLSPVVNLATDVRWGRTEETWGEDPYLASLLGAAFVAGFEEQGVITTPKHLVANVGAGGRDSYPIGAGERELRELYLPPFAACFGAGSRSVMTAYNSLDGVPCSANAWLNRTWLKDELGFGGFVISDAGAVGGIYQLHRTADGWADAAAQALAGGLDVIFQTSHDHFELYYPAVERVRPEVLDAAVARVLRAKFELGLFERPYVESSAALRPDERQSQRELALRAARESIVLLENDGTLPLEPDLERIAVLGPDSGEARLGGYSGPGERRVSILEGIRSARPGMEIVHAPGCERAPSAFIPVPADYLGCRIDGQEHAGLAGEYHVGIDPQGDPALVRVDGQVAFRWTLGPPAPGLPGDSYSVRWTGWLTAPVTGSLRLGVEADGGWRLRIGEEVVLDRWRDLAPVTRAVELQVSGGDRIELCLEYRQQRGPGMVNLVWDHGATGDEEATLAEAVEMAAGSGAAVVVVGLEEGEFRDRSRLSLPGRQEELIRRVAATGTPTAVVLVGGSAVTTGAWRDEVGSVLCAWYPGEAGGEAVADVLFGEAGPGGRLPVSFPEREGQLPLSYLHLPTGRGDDYRDGSGRAAYPFGYGLAYTTFRYSDLRIDPPVIAPGASCIVRCTVSNDGSRAGDEVVQLYLRDEVASRATPPLALRGVRRLELQPGESREVAFELGPDALALLDASLRPVVEPGDFRILVGASSRDLRLHGTLTVTP